MSLDIAITDGTAAFVRATTGERFERNVDVRVTSPSHAHYDHTGTITLVYMHDIKEVVNGKPTITISIPSATVTFPSGTAKIPTAILTTSAS
ncbi:MULTISPECIES: hypothetical protein [unclassified Streptomyces]|uniref:hypothetical protein n=1 Tax=unclassified Streptomyces TaxID=2593676 RepID=UPI00081EB1C7|nr:MULTISPECIES: hypothetical protein [unclassified Streptomyces]MYZ40618.1 hypothetical protein [Streptomyces sp. SID4917]SCG08152.1 hypothetical protein GA0115259_1124412 [Streptomyces sp. MnatMP-M17]